MLASAPPLPLLGKTTPRIFTPPLVTGPPGPCGCGCALTPKTSLGFAAVDFATETLGIPPLPFQRWLLIHALELLPSGRFRFRTVLVMISRQNGKTRLVEIKNLFKMFVLGIPLVLGTAQDLDTAEESWGNAVDLVENTEELAAELDDVVKVNGKKALKLTNGSRWKVRAASRRGGRGLSGDDVNFDELREHLVWDSWGAVTKTTMARPNAQIWAYSNAGDKRSVVLNSLQKQGRAAAKNPELADPQTGFFEWSAPEHVKCTCKRVDGDPHGKDCRLRDHEAWAQANPALGYTITLEALESALNTDPAPIFQTECLCQQVDDLGGKAIDFTVWLDLLDAKSRRHGDVAIGVDIAPLRDYAAVGVYGMRVDGVGHMQLLDYRPGTDWIVDRLVELKQILNPLGIGMGRGTFKSLETDLAEAGIRVPEDGDRPRHGDVLVLGSTEMSAACGQLLDVVRQRALRVVAHEALNAAVQGAKTRESHDTIAWSRKTADSDICPLVASNAAMFTFKTWQPLIVVEDYDVLDSIG